VGEIVQGGNEAASNKNSGKKQPLSQVEDAGKKQRFVALFAKKAEGCFIFVKKQGKRFAPFVPAYAVHLTVVAITLLVVLNNLEGYRDQKGGEDKEGTSVLFSGIIQNSGEHLVESRLNPEATVSHGIGGFISEMSGTVLAAQDNTKEAADASADPVDLPTVSGSALMPLPSLEKDIAAGPIEEARLEVVEHIVNPGESVSAIAANYGVSAATILSANNLSETSYIRPGDSLKIPPVSGVLYTVKPGDTLGEIAQTYKGDLDKIIEYNNLGSSEEIQIGQSLMIPGGKIPPPPAYSGSSRNNIAENQKEPIISPSIGSSGWVWPTVSHRINQYYSYGHRAVDIDGDTGSPLYAARAGTIIFAGWRGGYGKCVIISHPNGAETLYGHLSSYKRTSGSVGSGELIGYMGSTGWSTGPHLHFEIRTGNGLINPLNIMR